MDKNTTSELTEKQAISVLEAIPTNTLKGMRNLALIHMFFMTGCRLSAIIDTRVDDVQFDGVEYYLHITEKRKKESKKILLRAARAVMAYIEAAIRNGAQMHEVREFLGHSDIRTTELYFVRKKEDAENAARRIQIRVSLKST